MERVISFFGLFAMIGLAWLLSSNRRILPWRVIFVGLGLQIVFGLLILRTEPGLYVFQQFGELVGVLLGFVDSGTSVLFGLNPKKGEIGLPDYIPDRTLLLRSFAFGILPTIIFFSSLMSVLYHLRIMQLVVFALAWVMQRTLGTSGAETLSAAANIFVGQTEAPLVIRPYVAKMTMSELMVVMVGGFATIAGGVMAVYVGMGIDAGHLLTASVISAPAALLIAKVMQPETEVPETSGKAATQMDVGTANVIEAAAEGATAGLQLALNVGAMLIAFFALIAMLNGLVEYIALQFGIKDLTLQVIFGYVFSPLAWLMGVESKDCMRGGELLGIKWFLTEFVAYDYLGNWMKPGSGVDLSDRSATILTYALCGFANFASIGIQIGGIGAIAPERRSDLAKLGLRAMIGGTLAACMTGCIAGVLYSPEWKKPELNVPTKTDSGTEQSPTENEEIGDDQKPGEVAESDESRESRSRLALPENSVTNIDRNDILPSESTPVLDRFSESQSAMATTRGTA